MSELKFACPVCGQHITADSANSGSPLECPTCYRKIVVPQAPASAESKFILSAAEANKPRPPQASQAALEPAASQPTRTAWPVVVGLILLGAGLAGATIYILEHRNTGSKTAAELVATNASTTPADDDSAAAPKNAPAPVSTNAVAWNLDLAGSVFPEARPAGKLRGEFVDCNRTTVTGGALGFRQATRGLTDLSVTVYFFAKGPDELRGKTISVTPSDTLAPRVILRLKEGKETQSQNFTNGYALKIEFGEISDNHLVGKVYLSLPDEAQSRLAGSFSAEIKTPSPGKPKSAKPKSGS